MSGMPRNFGERRQQEWNIPAIQTRYHYKGEFYIALTKFPGALADFNGYVVFKNKAELRNSKGIETRLQGLTNLCIEVPKGISRLCDYVKKRK